jgi:hypothetical protein
MKETIFRIGSAFTEEKPAWAMAAPAKPPISACEEDEGMPNHQVRRFQKVAARRPENTTGRVINSCFTVLAIVFATPCSLKIKKAAKLNNAAQHTAWKGVSTFVETMVAIEFAAS